MLEAVDLQCVRGHRTLFSGLGFRLDASGLLRVAGANGSGKTSLLRILCGLLAPAEGTVRWRGEDIQQLREAFWGSLIYIGHAAPVKADLTAGENLAVACALAGVRADRGAVGAALTRLGLAGCERLPARALSQGQRRRVALARLALGDSAPLWLLDEPFTALDGAATTTVRQLIAEQLARGGAVIYTSHAEVPLDAAEARLDLGEESAAA
jgi:heme exporter protein A